MKRAYLGYPEKKKLSKFLEPLISKHLDGYWHYKPGYSDTRVAKEFGKLIGAHITHTVVAFVRKVDFGETRPYRPKKEVIANNNEHNNSNELIGRIEKLEAQFARFAKDLGYDTAAE